MIIHSVKLENIRSYLNQTIEFPKGSVLLAGDIGSGKSTILQAIEFALFGTKRAELAGESLLRHGKKDGSVELKFSIGSRQIIAKRNLKRGKDAVQQGSGYVLVDDVKKEGTAVELKSWMLEMLGYPMDLVSKSKDLVYRYTVYTPQESMKHILMEDKDTRLDTLRKVFNIDKYKRITENSGIVLRDLKERRKKLEGSIMDLEGKKAMLDEKKDELGQIDAKTAELKPKLEKSRQGLKERKAMLETLESEISALQKLKSELSVSEAELRNNNEMSKRNAEQILLLESQISKIIADTGKMEDTAELRKKAQETNLEILKIDKELREIRRTLSESRLKKTQALEIKQKIGSMAKCPLCEQDVKHEHKNSISEREGKNIEEMDAKINEHSAKEKEKDDRINSLRKEYEEILMRENKARIMQMKIGDLEDKRKQKDGLENAMQKIKYDALMIAQRKAELNERASKFLKAEENYKKARAEHEKALEEERKLEIGLNSLMKEKEGVEKIRALLESDVEQKIKAKEKLGEAMQLQNWLEEGFMNLMGAMERHVMVQVNQHFSSMLQNWFNMLIEDESLNVRLDDEFTPIIEQNGYETSLHNLSGGEKTSVALAYRLALNRAINDVMTNIKTNDIIMLDEPTDGFSSEQLDRVRDVLRELKMGQVIIVSHEHKIESFVDNVIRVNKKEHVSEVIS